MSENVFEWCNDEWAPDRFQNRTGTTRDPRPFGPALAPRVYLVEDLCTNAMSEVALVYPEILCSGEESFVAEVSVETERIFHHHVPKRESAASCTPMAGMSPTSRQTI